MTSGRPGLERLLIAGVLAGCLVQGPASRGQAVDAAWRCLDGAAGFTPIGMASYANAESGAVEARIRRLLEEVRPLLSAPGGGDMDRADAAWRGYRDLHCGLYEQADGGPCSQAVADVALCRIGLALAREAELRSLLKQVRPR